MATTLHVPLFYRIPRTTTKTCKLRLEAGAETDAIRALRGRQVVVCPRFPVPYDSPTLQGVPIMGCMLCDVLDVPDDPASVVLHPTMPVSVIRLLEDADVTECLLVDAEVEILNPSLMQLR